MPNLASRNHSGVLYCLSDSQVGLKRPSAIFRCCAEALNGEPAKAVVPARVFRIVRLVIPEPRWRMELSIPLMISPRVKTSRRHLLEETPFGRSETRILLRCA